MLFESDTNPLKRISLLVNDQKSYGMQMNYHKNSKYLAENMVLNSPVGLKSWRNKNVKGRLN
ncbi:MAG: hypothetical protein EA409_06925 [Saprospirales bacterium]|nr:MAG: hypothetical protein EA409_06925 [Saprospirales bacterium]